MTMIVTYNASYGIYEVRDAASLEALMLTPYETEAKEACETGELPEHCYPVH